MQDLAPDDLVDPGLVDPQFPQHVRKFVDVACGPEIGRRALQHRDMRAIRRDRGDQGRRGGARADHDDLLAVVVQIVRPLLRVNDRALEGLDAIPLRRIALRMTVIALAHPQEVRGHCDGLAGIGPRRGDRPQIVSAGPVRLRDLVPIADVAGEVVLIDDLAHVAQNLRGGGDRRAQPWLEPITEGMQVAVGANARVAVGDPGAAEGLLRFQDNEARAGALLRQVPGAAHPGDTGADDQDVEVFGLRRRRPGDCRRVVHGFRSLSTGTWICRCTSRVVPRTHGWNNHVARLPGRAELRRR